MLVQVHREHSSKQISTTASVTVSARELLYTVARHELPNETNRDEVEREVPAWLAKTV